MLGRTGDGGKLVVVIVLGLVFDVTVLGLVGGAPARAGLRARENRTPSAPPRKRSVDDVGAPKRRPARRLRMPL